jgi:hypothetical protein
MKVAGIMQTMLPKGSEQLLSLTWALEKVADFSQDEAIKAVCEIFGIKRNHWDSCIQDNDWFVGDNRWNSCELVESKWNARFSGLTNTYLDEDVWHMPLWQLWLKDPKMVLAENLMYLIKIQGRGTVVKLAKFTGRNITTASKWGRWLEEGRKVRVPPTTLIPKILEFFELKPTCDLYHESLFLGRASIQDAMLRIKGKHYLDCLSGDYLKQAINSLQEESVRQASKTFIREFS